MKRLDPHLAARGRSACSNRSSRSVAGNRDVSDNGAMELLSFPQRKTRLHKLNTRLAIAYNSSPDLGFDRSINPYKGCEHGCIYCYAHLSHGKAGHSAGLEFETEIFAKPDPAKVLRRELAAPSYRPTTLVMGGNTDIYQPAERSTGITRSLLEVLCETRHPVALVTRSSLVLRDLDLLAPMARLGLAKIAISLTTLDGALARRMEPRASTPQKRLNAIRALSEAGIPVQVMTAPIVPGLNDHEIEAILEAAAGAGATSANYVLLRLPHEVAPLFTEWVRTRFPDRAGRILSLICQTRGGKDDTSDCFEGGRGRGSVADMIGQRFVEGARRFMLATRGLELRTDHFVRPTPDGHNDFFSQPLTEHRHAV
jgi:DNA repair photolyase